MSNYFFDSPSEVQAALIKQAGMQWNLPATIIEKDLWICWLLEKLFAFDHSMKMVFKGGTSLSKVFNVIDRFSEDCDITLDYRNFESELDLNKITRSQLDKVSKRLKIQLKDYTSNKILPYLNQEFTQAFPQKAHKIILSEDGEKLEFYYPSIIIESLGYLDNNFRDTQQAGETSYILDHVLIEFGNRNTTEPYEKHQIHPYLSAVLNEDSSLPKPIVHALSPLRTFWEKATLIHVECHRERLAESPERLSRHWYDLHRLYQSTFGEEALKSMAILKDVIQHKKAFFNASYAHYDDCLKGKFILIPKSSNLSSLEADFTKMVKAGMFQAEPSPFKIILEDLKLLESKINQIS